MSKFLVGFAPCQAQWMSSDAHRVGLNTILRNENDGKAFVKTELNSKSKITSDINVFERRESNTELELPRDKQNMNTGFQGLSRCVHAIYIIAPGPPQIPLAELTVAVDYWVLWTNSPW
ncbi:hypothetical protein B0H14DRAFT_2634846 [Mycena olivaceomarginata]|nr:hypothetical protein B0H14DRAFT_2634846 [Mycena olivaceomarginata]